jgi:tetratricopeptide (TPR) repeat protein
VKRAQAVKPEFALTEATAPAVVGICAQLEGLPLAIELAAARSRLFAPQALLARLQPERGRLQFLTGGARDLPTRQQTIRNTIAWSYGLLSDAEQRLFRRLAVFIGGWTVEGVEAVCDIDGDLEFDVLDGLTALVEQSLVKQIEGPDGEPRFRRLETIREYAIEQLAASSETDLLRARHAAYYLQIAEEAEPALRGPDQVVWLDRLDVEYLNLRAALAWFVAGGMREDGMRLGAALSNFWHLRGHFREGDHWMTQLVSERTGITAATEARAVYAAGWLAYLVSDMARSRELYEEAVVLSRAAGERSTYARALVEVGQLEEGLAVARESREEWVVAATLGGDAYVLAHQGRWDEAYAAYEASVAAYGRLGGPHGVYLALGWFASMLYERGQYEKAEAKTHEALGYVTRMGQGAGVATCHLLLAQLAHARGRDAQATTLLGESLAGFRKSGHRSFIAQTLVWMSKVALAQGDDSEALVRIDEALALCRQIGDRPGTRWALQQAAQLARLQGNTWRAVALLQEAIALVVDLTAAAIDWVSVDFILLDDLAGLAAVHGESRRAAVLFGAAEAQRDTLGLVITPAAQVGYLRDVETAQTRLDKATWEAAWAEGRAMTLEQAIAYALETNPE